MVLLIIAFLVSLVLTGLLIRYRSWHINLSGDHDLSGPQKFHYEVTPRIGGIGIFCGYCIASGVEVLLNPAIAISLWMIALCGLPIFLAGLAEDLTKRVGAKFRLIAAFISGLLFCYFFNITVIHLDIPLVDAALNYPALSVFFLAFAIAGLSNAYNIIDGFHGLASMVAIIAATGILYIAYKVQDPIVIRLALITIGSIAAFFIWNYPRGLIFLGDGGAYWVGFLIALASILLVVRNPAVSPWFALMVNAYPVFETLFTIWRRAIHQGRNPGLPDGAHFHSLIYRRIMRWVHHEDKSIHYLNNAKTSPYLWLLSSLGVIPAILWWNSTPILMLASLSFIALYVYTYFKIVTFHKKSSSRNRPSS